MECSFIDYRLQDHGVAVLTLDNPPLNLTTLVTLDKLLTVCRHIASGRRRGHRLGEQSVLRRL